MIEQLSAIGSVELNEIDVTTLVHVDVDYAIALCSQEKPHVQAVGSLATSNQLITSLEQADVVIIASPMHNYSLPSGLKCWVDHVVRAGRTFEITSTGKRGLLSDKPVYIFISAGGVFSGEGAYQTDFFTPYMTEVLATIGLMNVIFFTIEGTAATPVIVQKQVKYVHEQVREHVMSTFSVN
jgi:FMN-dependent NADH-azoreductase